MSSLSWALECPGTGIQPTQPRFGGDPAAYAESIPEALSRRGRVRHLRLEGEEVTSLERVSELPGLTVLILGTTRIEELGSGLDGCRELEYLRCETTQAIRLGEQLSALPKLRALVLRIPQLRALPDSIGKLTKLQVLKVQESRLETLPKSIGLLTKLRSLDVYRNDLCALPDSIGQLTALQNLDLGGN